MLYSLPPIAIDTQIENCLLSFISDCIVGKLGAPAKANMVVLNAENIKFNLYLDKFHKAECE